MSNPTESAGPEPLFGARGQDVAVLVFRCGLCNTLAVDEPGRLCDPCTTPAAPSGARRSRSTTARASTRKARGERR